jgi:hypothetical protein
MKNDVSGHRSILMATEFSDFDSGAFLTTHFVRANSKHFKLPAVGLTQVETLEQTFTSWLICLQK